MKQNIYIRGSQIYSTGPLELPLSGLPKMKATPTAKRHHRAVMATIPLGLAALAGTTRFGSTPVAKCLKWMARCEPQLFTIPQMAANLKWCRLLKRVLRRAIKAFFMKMMVKPLGWPMRVLVRSTAPRVWRLQSAA